MKLTTRDGREYIVDEAVDCVGGWRGETNGKRIVFIPSDNLASLEY